MAYRQGPQLPSLIYDKAVVADHVMRPEAADSHQGQGRDPSRDRPDRFVHSNRRSQAPPQKAKARAWASNIISWLCRGYARM